MSKVVLSDDILGKDALDPEGGVLGVIVKLHVDEETKQVTGITVDQGFMKPELFIGSRYIKKFGVDAVLLNRVPESSYKGLPILTFTGELIGIVKEVSMKKSKIRELIGLSKNIRITGEKEFIISNSQIKEIGARVILNKNVKF